MFLRDATRKAIVLKVQNVSDYFWETNDGFEFVSSFPSARCPWPVAWLEWFEPNRVRMPDGSFRSYPKTFGGLGALVQLPLNSDRCLAITIFSDNVPGALVADTQVRLTPVGDVDPEHDKGGFKFKVNSVLESALERQCRLLGRPYDDGARVELGNCLSSIVKSILLAFSFANCRNVRRVCEEVDPKLRKARERRGKPAVLRTYTLRIDPMREILDREGQRKEKGLAHALHICRGHFKNYDERPLFGRVKGRFWWPSHVRGDIKQGAVVKDYEIGPVTPER